MQNPSRRKAHMPTKRGSRAVTVEQSESKHGLLEGALYVPLKTHTEVLELPLLPIRNTVLMPNVVTPLFVGRDQSMKAIDDAMGKGRTLVVVTQLNEEIEDPGPDDMYAVGVEGSIDRLLKMPDGSTSILLSKELNILELENLIHSQVQQEVDKTQREYFLREQLKAIQRELGETDPTIQEHEELREKILTCGMPEEVKMRANKELERLNALPSMAPDGGVIRTYLDWLVSLPWDKVTTDRLDIKEAAAILEENHYGLEKVKERVLEYIAVRKLSHSMRSPILCFVGPPGVGK